MPYRFDKNIDNVKFSSDLKKIYEHCAQQRYHELTYYCDKNISSIKMKQNDMRYIVQ